MSRRKFGHFFEITNKNLFPSFKASQKVLSIPCNQGQNMTSSTDDNLQINNKLGELGGREDKKTRNS